MFTNKQLYKLVIPLIVEQTLAMMVGMVDIIMISSAGEAAVSGVSLVDSINVLLINIFSALATGGAVVAAQYLGQGDEKKACKAADQLMLVATSVAIVIMIFSLVANNAILSLIFGNVEPDVMKSARIYFYITALSYPFLGIYNAGAALFRAMGNSKISMNSSFCMNGVHVVLNAYMIYVVHMGVAGVASSTLISRVVASVIVLLLIRSEKNVIHINPRFRFGFHKDMIRRILGIGIPNGLENSMFQIGKILVQRMISGYGTTAIAANAVANTIAGIEIIPGAAIGLSLITVVGQCVGANDYKQAKVYTRKLMKMAYLALGILNLIIFLLCKPIISIYSLSPETAHITLTLLLYHSVCCALIWPCSFTLPNALRAASDVKYPMEVSIISMWVCRIGLSYLLGSVFGLGVLGVWIAMTLDWLLRSVFFVTRYVRGKWMYHKII